MREKIKNIATKVGFQSIDDNCQASMLEEFAELIALEVISIIQSQQGINEYWDDWDYGYDAALDKTENDVRKYFNV
jgi:hypothetical protein